MQDPDIYENIEDGWKQILNEEFSKPYFLQLKEFLTEERKNFRIYPPLSKVFDAFNKTPFFKVKVVILGQDPYHGQGQAHGLCFSVNKGVAKPPSLKNIMKEIHRDMGIEVPLHGDLGKWARQGVLLLNATLTVRANIAGSHQKKGWEELTDQVISKLSQEKQDLIFLLWGKYAQAKQSLIDNNKHYILTAPHPSPLSASKGFKGCSHFSKTNEILRALGKKEIDWCIE